MISSENFNKNSTALLRLIGKMAKMILKYVMLAGTHALDVNKDVIQQIDDQLSSIASEHELHTKIILVFT